VAGCFELMLQIAQGEIKSQRKAIDESQGFLCGSGAAALADSHHQFGFEVEFLAVSGPRDILAGWH
jgi:hypothetical protein